MTVCPNEVRNTKYRQTSAARNLELAKITERVFANDKNFKKFVFSNYNIFMYFLNEENVSCIPEGT